MNAVSTDGSAERLNELLDAAGVPGPRRLLGRSVHGSSHVTLKVSAGDRVLAVRLPVPAPRFAVGVEQEGRVLRAVSDAGLAPQLLHFDPLDGGQVSVWEPAPVWTAEDLGDPDAAAALADQLQRLHALKLDVPAFDLAAAAEGYRRTLIDAGIDDGMRLASRQRTLAVLVDRFIAWRRLDGLAHNDLVTANVVGRSPPRLLDWEYAAANDRLFDVATLTGLHDLPPGARGMLLEVLALDATERERLDDTERLVRLLAWVWARAELARRRCDPRPLVWLRQIERWL